MTTAAALEALPALQTIPIEVVDSIDPETFRERHWNAERPLIIDHLADDWPAMAKWTPEYLRETSGQAIVGVFDSSHHEKGDNYLSAREWITFDDYLQRITAGPSELRLVAWQFRHQLPKLLADILPPTQFARGKYHGAHIFAGGTGSVIQAHFDPDVAHIFHTVVRGRKRVTLSHPRYSRDLYRYPFSCRSYVDLVDPDLARYPRVAKAELHVAELRAGQTLYMPPLWWHQFHYFEYGYAVTQRYWDGGLLGSIVSSYNIGRIIADRVLHRLFGARWHRLRERWAQ